MNATDLLQHLEHFRQLLETQQRERYARDYPHSVPPTVTIKTGKKYIKVDIDRSGAYMVESDTGDIYGIKAYGVIHRGHKYGNVATVDAWSWGDYRAVPKSA